VYKAILILKQEMPLFLLHCVFATQKYRGRCHVVTEGLTLTAKKFMKSFQPFFSETIVSSGYPLYRYRNFS